MCLSDIMKLILSKMFLCACFFVTTRFTNAGAIFDRNVRPLTRALTFTSFLFCFAVMKHSVLQDIVMRTITFQNVEPQFLKPCFAEESRSLVI